MPVINLYEITPRGFHIWTFKNLDEKNTQEVHSPGTISNVHLGDINEDVH